MQIDYQIEDHDIVCAQIEADGKVITHKNITDLDMDGRPTNCFVIVEDAPPAPEGDPYEIIDILTGEVE